MSVSFLIHLSFAGEYGHVHVYISLCSCATTSIKSQLAGIKHIILLLVVTHLYSCQVFAPAKLTLTGLINCLLVLNTPRYVIHHTTMSNGGKHVISTCITFHSVSGIC